MKRYGALPNDTGGKVPREILFFALMIATVALLPTCAYATTKGLNQIVTPDVQPYGDLSVSFQQTDPNIANRYQAQFEYGFTNRFEAAVFQGFAPDDEVLNVEYGIIQHKDFLLSTGFSNWSTKGVAAQPYLEAGYIKGKSYAMAGVTEQGFSETIGNGTVSNIHQLQAILGYAYRVQPRLLLQVDYQAGQNNFSSAGFTYSITPTLQFNPAAYFSNAAPIKGYGYAVLTYNITIHP
jgi:hypothetical protein